ncbi:hypothetical protein BSKO_01015 [Bryopsis sp. KO-2023]|nr:hypothetical protein BSKO_01015 [Bryopsis sp. KO-2023]
MPAAELVVTSAAVVKQDANSGNAWGQKSAPNPSFSSFVTMHSPWAAKRGLICAVCMLAANFAICGLWLTDPTTLVTKASNIFSLGTAETRKLTHVKGGNAGAYETKNVEFRPAHDAPKVALMFLTIGNLPHEPSWRAFFEAAGRLELDPRSPVTSAPVVQPKELVGKLKPPIKPFQKREDYETYRIQDAGGYHRRLLSELEEEGEEGGEGPVQEEKEGTAVEENPLSQEMKRLLKGEENGGDIRRAQSLFSLYVNAPPGFEFPSHSLFYGTIIPNPVNVINGYGQWVTVQSQIAMIREALKDPRNEKFALLSESCIPIHSPEIVYGQLIGEPRSEIDACPSQKTMVNTRFNKRMVTDNFTKADWRKSPQWTALNRDHSLLVMEDQHVKEIFKRHCFRRKSPRRGCTPNEHYIPSMLGSYGLDNQTTCSGVTYTEWPNAKTSTHPRTFKPPIVNAKLIRGFHGKTCNPAQARSSTQCLFKRKPGVENQEGHFNVNVTMCDPTEQENPTWVTKSGYQPLPARCSLFARKFKKESVTQALEAVLSCDGVGLGHWC